MSKLFSPLTVRSVTFRNRIFTSPMCMYSSVDGFATDWHLVHYGSRAMGGAGAVMLEATAVMENGRIGVGDLGIWKDEHIVPLGKVADFIKNNGSVPGIQLAHSGRKGSQLVAGKDSKPLMPGDAQGWEVIAPSSIPFSAEMQTPRAMSADDIATVKQAFVDATIRALKAGFELIEIHSAHGYLLNEFLSPITNKRTDGYGGSLESRSKLLFEVIAEVKKVWPVDLPIAVRISATDWMEEGWKIEDSVWLSRKLVDAGIDIVDVSTGGTVPNAKITVGSGYQLPYASAIKREVKEQLLVGTVGMITNAHQAETILTNGDADLIYMARELLRDPYFPLKAAKELRSEIPAPKPYELAFGSK
ncbi:NADH:flavin oxidoreductase/NADH oxidase [Chryseobacterium sp. WG14]|uniref:NADH:flavin oxidoreductase/NADH oxidase n=1 Tax=unclassified Chryseobacterium TaxID=2593645 RepID=UPI00211DC2BF|nr:MULTISPECIES: NADH:flavin oxidoreductase/NADH oxidase [unclassified Chryseobacterium]MCQ9636355.1 NADH:flavin oxidoreductase/NADH oxidase [Chryseobacterium sp. WG23]MCQ9641525.1 NADH:flavin oxidoreductase/NADH oxidase [Chryseobacterium sp. WG14]